MLATASVAIALTLAGNSLQAATPIQEQPPAITPKQQKEIDKDVEQGKKYSEEVEKELKLSKKEDQIARVQRVGKQMAGIANTTHVKALWGDKKFSRFEYTFKVVEGKDVNAFSLPGGYIYVYEGLVDYVESDHELAGVLAHEIAHASLRHIDKIQRQQSKLQAQTLPIIIAAILAGGRTGQGLAVGTQIFGLGSMSGWSQEAERAADYASLQYMRRTNYDPTGSLTVVERLARDERNKPRIDWGIFRTHPPSEERAKDLMKWMREAALPIRRSAVTKSFSTQLKTLDGGLIEAWFAGKRLYAFGGTDAKVRADAAALRLNAFFDETPDLADVRAAGSRVLGRNRTLIEISSEDAAKSGQTVGQLTESTVKAIKGALFSLGYQTWNPAL